MELRYHVSGSTMSTEFHIEQIRSLRAMSVAERLVLNASLWEHARVLKEAALRKLHEDWSDEQVRQAAREALQHAGR